MANPFDGLDPDAVLRELRKQADDLENKATQLRTDLASASATATSPDGAVTVTLSPTGALQDITFAGPVSKVAPDLLGPLVMKTAQAAQREVSDRVTASLAQQFGDSETMDFITQLMPKPPAAPRRDTGEGVEEGSVLRKRQGGRPRTDPDTAGGSLLR
ncbi:MAG: YbaB/EbfC family nucleoid-associated protein [Actinophytocola sp.]|uniref:YbaB/EbfC family nucleoid-associated protein n=1 Tax=Actinophytocola sp. TaxID=1872138 RepID=UPI003C7118BE